MAASPGATGCPRRNRGRLRSKCRRIHRVVDAAGKKRLILFSGLYPIRMSVSEDDGATWSELKPIGNFGGIVTMGSVVPLKKPGEYLAFFHDDGRFIVAGEPGKVKSLLGTVQRAGGASRGVSGSIKSAAPTAGSRGPCRSPIAMLPDASLCEPGAVRSPDGNEIAVLLRENSRKHNSYLITSKDEGLSWSQPKELPAALTGDRHTAKYAPDGRLFITFRDTTRESPTKGDWVAWVGKYEDIVAGREGQYRVRFMHNTKGADCAYPGLEVLPDGTIVTTTYGHWTEGEPPYIMSVRLKLEELDAKARR